MTAALVRAVPLERRPLVIALPLLAMAAIAGGLHAVGQTDVATGVLLALAIAFGLALHVDLPWGGRLTLGHAVIVAIVASVEPRWSGAIVVAGIALALPAWLDHAGQGTLAVRLAGMASVAIAAAVGILARIALDASTLGRDLDADDLTIAYATAVGVAFLGTDHVVRALVARTTGERSDLRQAWPLYVTLMCVAILIDLFSTRSVPLTLVAAVPLLVTRFSFQRYTTARTTYEQTTKALSLLPEVAGLTPLGHSERTAAYVEAVAPTLGFDGARVSHLVNVARLHHIGHISLHEEAEREAPPDPTELAEVSGEILQQTGFLANLVELVKDCQPGGPPTSTLDAAVISVCSVLDEIVEHGDEFDPFAALVAMHPVGHERAVAIALLNLSHRRQGLIAEARASVELIHQIAERAAAGDHHDH